MNIQKAIDMAIEGLQTDGAHHKQWYLEEILLALDNNLDELKIKLDIDWEESIAP